MSDRDGEFVFRPEDDDNTDKKKLSQDIGTPEPSKKDKERIEEYEGQPKTEAQKQESDDDNTIVGL